MRFDARVGGKPLASDDVMTVHAPYDGQVVGEVPACGRAQVDHAVEVARGARSSDPLPTWRRADVLDRAAEALSEPATAEDFARTIAIEAAKPIATARTEVARAVSTFRFAAATARTVAGEVLALDASPAGEGRLGFALRVPIGVVGAITPFNFPLNLVVHKVAPAIAAGCPVVLKPAHQTPITAIRLADLLIDTCGLPPSWLGTVTGRGASAGAALVGSQDVAMVTFTGSPDVGWGIRAAAPRKRVSLELGNNAPVIVHADGDWRAAAARIAAAGYSHAGQSCISVQRVLVHESVADDFTDELVAAVEGLVVGDPLDEAVQVSALIDHDNRDRVAQWIEEAVAGGASIATGGDLTGDHEVLRPTVMTGVRPEMRVCRDEVFGPVVGIATYSDAHEAFRTANRTRYGLHAGIFTSDISLARQAMEVLDFGGVIINDVPTWRADQMPYGGVRDSGNTREGPMYSFLEMTELRSVVLS